MDDHTPTVRPTVELRVPGIGYTSEEELMAGADVAAGLGRSVETFGWTDLVSNARGLTWWVLALPFTMTNLAGWMHPARSPMRSSVIRWLTAASAWLLTAAFAQWASIVALDVVGYQLLGHGHALGTRIAAYLGASIALIAFGVFVPRVSGRTAAEASSIGSGITEPRSRSGPADDERLFSPNFFAHEADLQSLRFRHNATWTIVLVANIVLAGFRLGSDKPSLHLGDLFVPMGLMQWAVLVPMAIVSIERPSLWGQRFRFAAPAVIIGSAVVISNAFWSGVVLGGRAVVDWRRDSVPAGPETALIPTLTWGLVGMALAGGLIALVAVATHRFVGKALVRNLDLTLVAGVAAAVAAGAWELWSRLADASGDWVTALRLGDSTAAPAWGWGVVPIAAALLIGAASWFLRRNAMVIGFWQILTFWPRRFHPYAIHPYSEVAVPRLKARLIEALRSDDEHVVISAHSQGSVLAVSALAGLIGAGYRPLNIRCVFSGSPLGTLYGRGFPHYFEPAVIQRVAVEMGGSPSIINMYRESDPVGGPISGVSLNGIDTTSLDNREVGSGKGHSKYFGEADVLSAIAELSGSLAASTATERLPLPGRVAVKPAPMVRWYSLSVLADSAIRLITRSVVAPFADRRETRAGVTPDAGIIDRTAFATRWVTFVADTGDGFDPTYAVAWHVSRALDVPALSPHGDDVHLGVGDALLLGGDLGYPIGTAKTYRQRLLGPYQQAADQAADSPEMLAQRVIIGIPGNHDHYDGLVGFGDLMFSGRTIGRWSTVQERSYTAVRLSEDWVVFMFDGGESGADFDPDQLRWFRRQAAQFRATDQFIVCNSVPVWVDGENDPTAMAALDRMVVAALADSPATPESVRLYLSGDSHHYAHLVDPESGVHYVTAGGGGAFTHPTHNVLRGNRSLADDTEITLFDPTGSFGTRHLRPSGDGWLYPNARASRRQLWRLWLFPFKNFPVSALLGSVSAFLAGMAVVLVDRTTPTSFESVRDAAADGPGALTDAVEHMSTLPAKIRTSGFGGTLGQIVAAPAAWIVSSLLVAAMIALAKPRTHTSASRLKAKLAGAAHGLVQVAVATLLAAVSAHGVGTLLDAEGGALMTALVAGGAALAAFVAATVAAGVTFGLYLALSNLLMGMHDNESFSALRLTTYKNFLALHLEGRKLTVYPVGLDRTRPKLRPRASRPAAPQSEADTHPVAFESRPRLIEAGFSPGLPDQG